MRFIEIHQVFEKKKKGRILFLRSNVYHKIRQRKVKLLPKIEEITVGQAHENLIEIFQWARLSFSIRREQMYVNTPQRVVYIIEIMDGCVVFLLIQSVDDQSEAILHAF